MDRRSKWLQTTVTALATVATALLLASCSHKDPPKQKFVFTDANWWSHRSPTEKGLAVEAAINGYRWGYSDAQLTDSLTVMRINDAKALQAMKTSTPDFNRPIHAYVTAIDDFYTRYPRSRAASVADIL